MTNDPYQEAYLLHQARKKQQLLAYKADAFSYLSSTRVSNRIFSQEKLPDSKLTALTSLIEHAPSSCDRKAIDVMQISGHLVPPLGSLLVGGRTWLEHAPTVFLIFANPLAYKAPNELSFMPFLDSGFMGMHLLYAAHSLDLAACYCNPNIRPDDLPTFNSAYNHSSLIFGGAVAVGLPQP